MTLGFSLHPLKLANERVIHITTIQVMPMKYIIASLLLLTSTICMAVQPENLPGNNGGNGNHFAYGKEGNNGNHNGTTHRSTSIPEASTLALLGLGLAGVIIVRIRKK